MNLASEILGTGTGCLSPWPRSGCRSAQIPYESRADLGDNRPGDGRKFAGRGLIQLTGSDNARACRDGLRKAMPGLPDFKADPTPL